MSREEPQDLEELLDRIGAADTEEGEVSLGAVFDEIGHRSFGPLLLFAGVVTLAPVVGDIPGVPTVMAVVVLVTAVQLIARREHIWMPGFLLRRTVGREKLDRGLELARKPAAWIDRAVRPRLTALTRGAGAYGVAAACIVVALAMPPMEVIPFSANVAGAALTLFGLALVARDGVMALLGFLLSGGALAIVVYNLI